MEFGDVGYSKREVRVGPPLDYVGGKMADALKALHDTVQSIRDHVPPNLVAPGKARRNPYDFKRDYLLGPGRTSFSYLLIGFLGLYDMMALATPRFDDELLAYSHDEFKAWVERIEREGSVLGAPRSSGE